MRTFGEPRPTRPALLSRGWRAICPIVKRRDHYRCCVCGATETWHHSATGRRLSNLLIGHKTPPERYMGSHNDPANLWTLCFACNASQGNRTVEEWFAAQSGRLVELGITGPKVPTTSAVITKDYSRRPE
jgi:hypothetical protein